MDRIFSNTLLVYAYYIEIHICYYTTYIWNYWLSNRLNRWSSALWTFGLYHFFFFSSHFLYSCCDFIGHGTFTDQLLLLLLKWYLTSVYSYFGNLLSICARVCIRQVSAHVFRVKVLENNWALSHELQNEITWTNVILRFIYFTHIVYTFICVYFTHAYRHMRIFIILICTKSNILAIGYSNVL